MGRPKRLRVLDLFCGAGGAAKGYASSSRYDITGVDIIPQPRYPYRFIKADATTYDLTGYDIIHASPPCQGHSTLRMSEHESTAWMLRDTIMRLEESDARLWVVENVGTAYVSASRPATFILCGSALGCITDHATKLYLSRHRKFWCNVDVPSTECACKFYRGYGWQCAGVYGDPGRVNPGFGYKATRTEAKALMGIDWMAHRELTESIPPAYTSYIMSQAQQLISF